MEKKGSTIILFYIGGKVVQCIYVHVFSLLITDLI